MGWTSIAESNSPIIFISFFFICHPTIRCCAIVSCGLWTSFLLIDSFMNLYCNISCVGKIDCAGIANGAAELLGTPKAAAAQ